MGDARAAPALLRVAGDFANAADTCHAAAVALGQIGDASTREAVAKLAADYPEVSTRQALMSSAQ